MRLFFDDGGDDGDDDEAAARFCLSNAESTGFFPIFSKMIGKDDGDDGDDIAGSVDGVGVGVGGSSSGGGDVCGNCPSYADFVQLIAIRWAKLHTMGNFGGVGIVVAVVFGGGVGTSLSLFTFFRCHFRHFRC